MRKAKLLFVLILSLAILWPALFFQKNIFDLYSRFSTELPKISHNLSNTITEQIEKQILTPPPLRAETESQQSFLTKDGIIKWTNIQRTNQGLLPLKENILLDSAAMVKTKDMLENQYFAHESLSGLGVGDLAENAGYEFIMIGENLALGNFENDQVLVQAWMDSPGHRANILNNRYSEIGVGIIKGFYEGRNTWLAVQHFGLPLSRCPSPEQVLREEINTNQAEIDSLQAAIISLEAELKSMKRKERESYNQKVNEYNAMIYQYNNLIDETKSLVEQYNLQVSLFNDCVSGE